MRSMIARQGGLLLAIAWLVASGYGLWCLAAYKNQAGANGDAPAQSPDAEPICKPFHMKLFAHPHCVCTRATIAELARLMTHCRASLSVDVLFLRPASIPDGWEDTDLWGAAARIPGVRVRWDDAGAMAKRYAAKTSGHAVLYDAEGRLRFQGGITVSRGHEGDSPGRTHITNLVNNGVEGSFATPAYGCALENPE